MPPRIFAIFKPKGPSSHDVLVPLKRRFKGEKVGHAGTLDPLASGVLVVGIGREATKQLHSNEFSEKEYRVVVRLGFESTTDDAEGEKTLFEGVSPPSLETVKGGLAKFVGTISQVPPQFSAIKVSGVPAYKQARRGNEVGLNARPVEIKSIQLLSYDWPMLELRVVTGPGAYIRSLARDLGRALGVGGYVEELERVRVGSFTLSSAQQVDELDDLAAD
jgi:tRNA pseudouridine55 synthase